MSGAAALIPVEQATGVGAEQWQLLRDQAEIFIKSGLLPSHIKSPEQAVVIMLKGRELGLPPMYALSTIGVINGKPVVAAEVMASLVYRHHGDEALRIVQSDERVCRVEYRRHGWREPQTYAFSIEDAMRAGLLGSQVWQKYPAAMLRARCISAVARMAFPDVISGVYTPEELGGAVKVEDDRVIPAFQVTATVVEERSDADLPPPRPLRPRGTAGEPPTAAQLARITRMRRVRTTWYGEDESQPVPQTAQDAQHAIALLQDLLRLPVPSAGSPATPDQRALVAEARRELADEGGEPGSLPEDLTAGGAYALYKDLLRQRARLSSGEAGRGVGASG
jgi:hypothetical protein